MDTLVLAEQVASCGSQWSGSVKQRAGQCRLDAHS